jgi:hypothetical protein
MLFLLWFAVVFSTPLPYRRAKIKLDAVKEESAKSEAQHGGSDWWFILDFTLYSWNLLSTKTGITL